MVSAHGRRRLNLQHELWEGCCEKKMDGRAQSAKRRKLRFLSRALKEKVADFRLCNTSLRAFATQRRTGKRLLAAFHAAGHQNSDEIRWPCLAFHAAKLQLEMFHLTKCCSCAKKVLPLLSLSLPLRRSCVPLRV